MMSQIGKKLPAQRPVIETRKRAMSRVDVRPYEGIEATIHLDHFTESIAVRVYDISIQGICIVVPREVKEHILQLQKYQIDLTFAWGVNASGIYSCCWIEEFKNNFFRIGFRNAMPTRVQGYLPVERKSNLLEVPKAFPIIGFFYKDYFYYERAAVRVLAISSRELQIEIYDTELLLLPGMMIELLLAVQAAVGPRIRGQVNQVIAVDERHVLATLTVEKIPRAMEADLVNHLLQNTDLSPEQIRNAGFSVREIANSFRFRYLRSQDEYEEVLKLRYAAYKKAGKVKENMTPADLAAPLDHISRILLAYHGSKLVASVALTFPEHNEEILDTERALIGGYPKKFPDKTKVIEVSRLSTDPEYRRGDLLLRTFEQIYKVLGLSDRTYLVSSTDNKLWPLYKRLGFKKINKSYLHPYLAGIEHHVIIASRDIGTHAKSIDPLRWNMLYGNMTGFLQSRSKIKHTILSRVRVALFQFIGRLMKMGRRRRY
jgi:hypothetical protein